MGGGRLAIVVLTATLISQTLGFSGIDCGKSNCQFTVVEKECQHSTTVFCNMTDWPHKQVRLTSTSLPRYASDVTIGNVKELVIEADAIASLAFLEVIKLFSIDNLVLLSGSFARNQEYGPIDMIIHDVKSLDVQKESFSSWGNHQSKVFINNVEYCRMLDKAFTSMHLRSLSIQKVTSLDIEHGAFRESSMDELMLAEMKSVSVSTGAFTAHITVRTMTMTDIDMLTVRSGAFAPGSSIRKFFIKRVPKLQIASGGIKSGINMLTLRDVSMETCEANTFGGSIKSLALVSTHINMTKANCVSADTRWTKLLVNDSHFGHIQSLSFYGDIKQVQIKRSDFQRIASGGFTMNVARFAVEDSAFGEMSEKAIEIHATGHIDFKNCTIDVLKRSAFSMLDLQKGATKRITMKNLKVETPENESLDFIYNENILLLRLELGIPCTCPIKNGSRTQGFVDLDHADDARKRQLSTLLFQVRCKHHTTRPAIGEYRLEFCPDLVILTSTTSVPTTATTSTGISSATRMSNTSINALEQARSTQQPQSLFNDDSFSAVSRSGDQTMEQTSDSADTEQNDSSSPTTLIVLLSVGIPVVLVVLVVVLVVLRRRLPCRPFNQRSAPTGRAAQARNGDGQKSNAAQYAPVPYDERQNRGALSRQPEPSSNIHIHIPQAQPDTITDVAVNAPSGGPAFIRMIVRKLRPGNDEAYGLESLPGGNQRLPIGPPTTLRETADG